jgi:hypothetical protein
MNLFGNNYLNNSDTHTFDHLIAKKTPGSNQLKTEQQRLEELVLNKRLFFFRGGRISVLSRCSASRVQGAPIFALNASLQPLAHSSPQLRVSFETPPQRQSSRRTSLHLSLSLSLLLFAKNLFPVKVSFIYACSTREALSRNNARRRGIEAALLTRRKMFIVRAHIPSRSLTVLCFFESEGAKHNTCFRHAPRDISLDALHSQLC